MRLPDDDHPIVITPNPNRIVVRAGGRALADTRNALSLKEASYPPVQYVPRADVDMALLQRTDHSTYCPFKGDCSYFSIPSGGDHAVNAVWSYETPYDAAAAIEGHLAFYPDRVEITEEPIV